MNKKMSYGIATLMVALLLSGCGKVPQAEIDLANAAIDSARLAGADIYLPEAFAAVQDSMKSALILSEGQTSRLIKNYGEVKDKLAQVSEQAEEVRLQTEARKEELRTQIQAIVADVKSLLEENLQLITQAPKGKEGTAALMSIKSELDVIAATVTEVEMMTGEGDLLACQSKIIAAKEKAASIKDELTEVISKYNKARR